MILLEKDNILIEILSNRFYLFLLIHSLAILYHSSKHYIPYIVVLLVFIVIFYNCNVRIISLIPVYCF